MADQEQLMTPLKKRVSFSQDVLVTLDVSFSMRERRRMYLSTEELQELQENLYDEANWARSLGAKSLQKDDFLRGLEMVIDDEAVMERRQQKFLGELAVFVEQERQFMENGSPCPHDFDSMALRYGKITMRSKAAARKRAIYYQEMEKSNNDDIRREGRIPMPTASFHPIPRFSSPSAA